MGNTEQRGLFEGGRSVLNSRLAIWRLKTVAGTLGFDSGVILPAAFCGGSRSQPGQGTRLASALVPAGCAQRWP